MAKINRQKPNHKTLIALAIVSVCRGMRYWSDINNVYY